MDFAATIAADTRSALSHLLLRACLGETEDKSDDDGWAPSYIQGGLDCRLQYRTARLGQLEERRNTELDPPPARKTNKL